jgi:hypothetical protein
MESLEEVSKVVIGSGLLAKGFYKSLSTNVVFFCSGVSNSKEVAVSEFKRERRLLIDTIDKLKDRNILIVYFSSAVSNQVHTKYTMHKRNMEKILSVKAKSYLLIKLPQVVGVTMNDTLVSFFIKEILASHRLYIQKDAERNLIDVEDVVRIVDIIIAKNIRNKAVSIGSKFNISPLQVLKFISNYFTQKNIIYELVDGGHKQKVEMTFIEGCLDSSDVIFGDKYAELVIKKYTEKNIESY